MEVINNIAGLRFEDFNLITQLGLLLFTFIIYGVPIFIIVMIAKRLGKKKNNNRVWTYDEKTGDLIDQSANLNKKEDSNQN